MSASVIMEDSVARQNTQNVPRSTEEYVARMRDTEARMRAQEVEAVRQMHMATMARVARGEDVVSGITPMRAGDVAYVDDSASNNT